MGTTACSEGSSLTCSCENQFVSTDLFQRSCQKPVAFSLEWKVTADTSFRETTPLDTNEASEDVTWLLTEQDRHTEKTSRHNSTSLCFSALHGALCLLPHISVKTIREDEITTTV